MPMYFELLKHRDCSPLKVNFTQSANIGIEEIQKQYAVCNISFRVFSSTPPKPWKTLWKNCRHLLSD